MPTYSDIGSVTSLSNEFSYDKQSKKFYYLKYRPDTWTANKETTQGVDVIIPTVPNGCKYEAASGGKTGVTEPTFLTTRKESTTDNDVLWKCFPYDLKLLTGDSITSSSWRVGSNDFWKASIDVELDYIVSPTTDNGYTYKCTTAGITGATEPVWTTNEGDIIVDGTAEFTAEFAGTFDSDAIVSSIATKVRLTSVPDDSTSVTLINHINVTRLNGDTEEFDRSLVIPIKIL